MSRLSPGECIPRHIYTKEEIALALARLSVVQLEQDQPDFIGPTAEIIQFRIPEIPEELIA